MPQPDQCDEVDTSVCQAGPNVPDGKCIGSDGECHEEFDGTFLFITPSSNLLL